MNNTKSCHVNIPQKMAYSLTFVKKILPKFHKNTLKITFMPVVLNLVGGFICAFTEPSVMAKR